MPTSQTKVQNAPTTQKPVSRMGSTVATEEGIIICGTEVGGDVMHTAGRRETPGITGGLPALCWGIR